MRRLVLLIICLLTIGNVANAQMSVGVTPIFSRYVENNPYMEQEFINRATLCEINAGILTHKAIVEGYHLFNKGYTDTGTINIISKGKATPAPVFLHSQFNASRVEIGTPFLHREVIVEPFFVESFTNNQYEVKKNHKPIYATNISEATAGFGVAVSHRIKSNNSVGVKYFLTAKDSMLNIKYSWFNKVSSFNVGYTSRAYSNIKIDGPYLSLSCMF